MSETKNRIFLTEKDTVTKFENNLVDLKLECGDEYKALEPRRLFPVTNENSYITLLDSEGVEVAMIRLISDLNADSKAVIEKSLSEYYFVPYITRIVSATEKYGTLHWVVETTKGTKEFDIRNSNQDIRVSSKGYVRVRDADDNRYIIEDYHTLDSHSRAQLIANL